MKVEFDAAKRDTTLRERALDMERALELFDGPTLTVADKRRDYGEERFISVGFLERRMIILVWTPRREAIRIISMRKANDRERKLYERRLARS